jgi:hypothetical protein
LSNLEHKLIKTSFGDTFSYKCSCGIGAYNSPSFLRSGSSTIWNDWSYQNLFQEHLCIINKLNKLGYFSIKEYYKTYLTDIVVYFSKIPEDIFLYSLIYINYDKDTILLLKEGDKFNNIFEISIDNFLKEYVEV